MATTTKSESAGLQLRRLDTVQDVNRNQWNHIVEHADLGCIFHRYEWVSAMEAGLDRDAHHLVLEKDGNPVSIFPNFVEEIERTPFRRLRSISPGFGGPLTQGDEEESLDIMIDAISDRCSGRTIAHEIRALDPGYIRYHSFLRSRGYRPTSAACRVMIDLTCPYEEIQREMEKTRRQGIKRGLDNEFTIEEVDATEAKIAELYPLYEHVMDRVDGTVLPLSFFTELTEMDSRILLVTLSIEGERAGFAFQLLDDEQSTVRSFLSVVHEDYFGDHAAELLHNYLIKWGIENGYDRYDFGDTSPDFRDGVFQFKERFGGSVVPIVSWERGEGISWSMFDSMRSFYWRYRDN